MSTKGEIAVERLQKTEAVLEGLKGQAHQIDDIKEAVEPASSNLELFLKAVVFPGVNPRTNFFRSYTESHRARCFSTFY